MFLQPGWWLGPGEQHNDCTVAFGDGSFTLFRREPLAFCRGRGWGHPMRSFGWLPVSTVLQGFEESDDDWTRIAQLARASPCK